jgi:hypothetical protein
MTTAVQVTLPQELVSKARQYIEQGFASNIDHLMAEALSRYLESHEPGLTENFIREDVEWGLHGRT